MLRTLAALPPLAWLALAPPCPAAGRLETLDSLRLPGLEPRLLHVWQPDSASLRGRLCWLVVAHDGRNLFDDSCSSSGLSWELDEALQGLIDEGSIPPVLVAAVGNTPRRRREYTPRPLYDLYDAKEQATFDSLHGGPSLADLYLAGLADTLVPWLRQRYPVLPDAAHTVLLGSSRGALFSLGALAARPDVFGRACCLSTHWSACGGHLEEWLGAHLPAAGERRLYLDHGDRTLDAEYPPFQAQADSLLAARGWRMGTDALSLSFPGDEHHERAWRRRVGPALRWLLETGGPPAAEGAP